MAFTIENNQPSAGCIRWTSLNMQYKGSNYAITDGYTNYSYVYWTPATPTSLVVSNTFPTLGADDCLVFLNKSGTAITVPNSTIIPGDLIVPGSIVANALAANTITGDKIAADTITANNIAAGTITASEIAANAIGASAIAANVITGDKLVADAITAREIAASTITANEIASNAITAAKIAANAIGATAIAAGAISADKLVANTITAASGVIADAAITTAKIADSNITTAKIADANITNAKIANLAVDDAKISDLNGGKIAANTITADKLIVGDSENYVIWVGKTAASLPWESRVLRDTSTYHAATASLKIPANTTLCNAKNVIPTIGGEVIYCEYWFKTESTWNGTSNLTKLRFADQAGTFLYSLNVTAGANTSWVKYSGTFTVPANTTYLTVSIGNDGTTGNVWFDDVVVVKQKDGELIVNGSITADKIKANSITTDKLVVGDGSVASGNLCSGKTYSSPAGNFATTLSVAASAGATTLTLTSVSGIAVNTTLTIGSEVKTVTAINGSVVTLNSAITGSYAIGNGVTLLNDYLIDDGNRTVGSSWFTFGTGSQNNNAAENGYVQVDLGASYRIAESRIFFWSGDSRYYYYKVKYSTDGTNWFYAIGNASNTGWVTSPVVGTGQTYNPTINTFHVPIVARYVRIYANGNTVNNGNHIYEWEMYCVPQTTIDGGQIKTGTIVADKIKGGTLNLGGTTYGNGLQKVYDASDNLIVEVGNSGIKVHGDTLFSIDKTVMIPDTQNGIYYKSLLTPFGFDITTQNIGMGGFGDSSAKLDCGSLSLSTSMPAGGSHRMKIMNRSSLVGDDTSGYTAFFANLGFGFYTGNDGVSDPMNSNVQVMEYSTATGWKGFHFNDKVNIYDDLTIKKKADNWSKIIFPAQTNDPGYIGHYENNNSSEMRFVVSDDSAATTDVFKWGVDASGTFVSVASLDTRGQLVLSNGVQLTSGEGKGYKFWDSSDNYKISMCSGGVGGRYGETTSDYNMYFNMGGGGTNRGYQFANNGTCFASLTPSGGFKVNNGITAVGHVTLDVSGGERQFKCSSGWGIFMNTAGFGGYDWTNSRAVWSYAASSNAVSFSPNVTFNNETKFASDGSYTNDPWNGTACAIKADGNVASTGTMLAYRSGGGDCFNAQNNVSTWAIHRGTSSYDMAFAPAWNWTNDVVFTSAGRVSAIGFDSRSDIKLKVNLTPLSGVLSKLEDINVYKYALKSDIELAAEKLATSETIPEIPKHLGVIAQEVEVHFPEIVNQLSDIDDTKTIDTYGLLAVALEAIKELSAEIKTLKERVGI